MQIYAKQRLIVFFNENRRDLKKNNILVLESRLESIEDDSNSGQERSNSHNEKSNVNQSENNCQAEISANLGK